MDEATLTHQSRKAFLRSPRRLKCSGSSEASSDDDHHETTPPLSALSSIAVDNSIARGVMFTDRSGIGGESGGGGGRKGKNPPETAAKRAKRHMPWRRRRRPLSCTSPRRAPCPPCRPFDTDQLAYLTATETLSTCSSSTPSVECQEANASMHPHDRSAVLSLAGNDRCAECRCPDPEWASVTLGLTLCLGCAGEHRALGTHVSFVRSMVMDAWSDEQVASMLAGGNNRCREILSDRAELLAATRAAMVARYGDGSHSMTLREKYGSKAADKYREELSKRSENFAHAMEGRHDMTGQPVTVIQGEGNRDKGEIDEGQNKNLASPPSRAAVLGAGAALAIGLSAAASPDESKAVSAVRYLGATMSSLLLAASAAVNTTGTAPEKSREGDRASEGAGPFILKCGCLSDRMPVPKQCSSRMGG